MDQIDLNVISDFVVDEMKRKGEIAPMIHAVDNEGRNHLMIIPLQDDAQKDALTYVLRAKFKVMKIIEYCFISEAWAVVRTKEEGVPDIPVKDCFDRVECVMIEHVTPDSGRLKAFKIVRDEVTGEFLKLTEFNDILHSRHTEEDKLIGRFATLIPVREEVGKYAS